MEITLRKVENGYTLENGETGQMHVFESQGDDSEEISEENDAASFSILMSKLASLYGFDESKYLVFFCDRDDLEVEIDDSGFSEPTEDEIKAPN